MTDEPRFLIWSIEHTAWWPLSRFGYTTVLAEAGRFSRRDAEEILRRANLVEVNECLIPLSAVEPHANDEDDDTP